MKTLITTLAISLLAVSAHCQDSPQTQPDPQTTRAGHVTIPPAFDSYTYLDMARLPFATEASQIATDKRERDAERRQWEREHPSKTSGQPSHFIW